jgi:O-antigen/teichoic acid export membrane protein
MSGSETGTTVAVRNGLLNATASGANAVVGLVGSIIIINSTTPEMYGVLSYYLWLAGVLIVIGTLAFHVATTKVLSELRGREAWAEERAMARTIVAVAIGANAVIMATVLCVAAWGPPEVRPFLFVIAWAIGPTALAAVLGSVLQARQQYREVAVATAIGALVQLALIVTAFVRGWGIIGYLVGVLSAPVVISLVLVVRLALAGTLALRSERSFADRTTWARFVSFLTPASAVVLLDAVVWQRSEVWFLSRFSSIVEVGYYNFSFTLFAMFMMLGWALVNGYFPAISHDFGARRWDRIRSSVRQALILAAVFAVPVTFGGISIAPIAIRVVYGEQMLPALPVVIVLYLGLFPAVAAGVAGIVLSALNRPWLIIPLGVVAAIINVALNLALIPRYGAFGGAIANTVAQVSLVVMMYGLIIRLWRFRLPWRSLAVVISLGFVATFLLPEAVQWAVTGPSGLLVAIVTAVAAYLLGLRRFGLIALLLRPAAPETPAGDPGLSR